MKEEELPQTFWEYLKMWGPGIVMVLTWWGAGDMVDTITAGSSYGYALMWAITVAIIIRGTITYLLGKYSAVNPRRETVLTAYARISKYLLWVLVIGFVYYLHMYGAFLLKSSASAIWYLLAVESVKSGDYLPLQ